jgi:iron complex outermembrane recepter protein
MVRLAHCLLYGILCTGLPAGVRGAEALDEIQVSARKIAEPLANVPLSIQVVTREELDRAGIDGLQTLAAYVPGLYVEPMWGGSNAQPTLRGQSHPGPGGNTVGVFIDGVLQGSDSGDDATMFDLERIEVVKGPQSALYGSSTFSGAINFVTRRPTRDLQSEIKISGATDAYGSVTGFLSGPLGPPGLLGRIAGGFRTFDGTGANAANPHDHLGGYTKWGGSASLEYDWETRWRASADVRVSEDRSEQPNVSTLTAAQYNCGSQNPVTGYWSFYCGDIPRTRHFDVSADLPDSETRNLQGSVRFDYSGESLVINSLTSYYRSNSTIYQDFDGTSAGETFGVCDVGTTCEAPGIAEVSRLVHVNETAITTEVIEQFAQELRLRYHLSRLDWLVGAQVLVDSEYDGDGIAAGPVSLADGERLTALLPATPSRVGPISVFNGALVAHADQVRDQESTTLHLTTTSVFAGIDYRFTARSELHGELRQGIGQFAVTTPRLSLDYRPGDAGVLWVSVARGGNAGGSNHDPRLVPSEQNYGPESEWTYEAGFRLHAASVPIDLSATAFYNDWRNAQIPGPSNSPGVDSTIVRNIRGISTPGFEFLATIPVIGSLSAQLAYTYDRPRFKAGSEDYGGSRFCGVTPDSTSSNFCTIGPSRVLAPGRTFPVPYVDGNTVQRAPEQQWTAALNFEPMRTWQGLNGFIRLAAEHQGRVFVRPVDGAYDGARTLLNCRVGMGRGLWTAQLWGTNLTDANYIRAVASRSRAYFPTLVQPQDLIYGDGRRFGVDLRRHF